MKLSFLPVKRFVKLESASASAVVSAAETGDEKQDIEDAAAAIVATETA